VVLPPATCDLDLSARTIPDGGGDVTVSWKTAAAASLILQSSDANEHSETLTSGWEDADTRGSITVPVTVATEFTMTVNGLGGKTRCSAKVKVQPPQVDAPTCTLVAAPTSILKGETSTLSWTTTNATVFKIDHDLGKQDDVESGSLAVTPKKDTTYTGKAKGPGGEKECSTTVTVTETPPDAPVCTLVASPTTVVSEEQIDFNADGKVGVVDGLALLKTAAGGLSCPAGKVCDVNGDGSVSAADALLVEKYAIGLYTLGQTRLSWTTSNGETFEIDQGIGSVTPVAAGSTTASPTDTTTYTGTVKAKGAVNHCSVTVKVPKTTLPPVDAPVCTLIASPSSTINTAKIDFTNDGKLDSADAQALLEVAVEKRSCPAGKVCDVDGDGVIAAVDADMLLVYVTGLPDTGTHILQWTTTNATSFTLDNNITKNVTTAIGTVGVSPSVTTTYTGTATGNGPAARCSVTITIAASDAPSCTLSASPSSVDSGGKSTLNWTTSNGKTFSLDHGIGNAVPVAAGATTTAAISSDTTFTGTVTSASGQTATCTAPVTIKTGGGGCTSGCGGGGGGGGSPTPTVVLSSTPHTGDVAGAYIYLSQIPYTGLDLGPTGTVLYWIALIGWSLALAYLVLFNAVPLAGRSARTFGERVALALNAHAPVPAAQSAAQPAPIQEPHIRVEAPAAESEEAAPRGYSSYEGFKSFAQNEVLSIEDIVKGLARSHKAPTAPMTEPVYENVEPIEAAAPVYEMQSTAVSERGVQASEVSTDVRGFASALVQGDREAVFAGLRQHVRGSGKPEHLVSSTVCLLDDVYRARVDGTECDPEIARLTARLSTPHLEKLIASLTTAIDSSYSAGVTGAKLALTRALTILGA